MLNRHSAKLINTWRIAFFLTITKANTLLESTSNSVPSGCGCTGNYANKLFGLASSCNFATNNQPQANAQEEKFNTFPSLFVAHGAPSLVLDNNEYTKHLRNLKNTMPKPEAIVLFSAHWELPVQMISDVKEYSTIYDFHGFPREMYSMTYPAKGNSKLASEIQSLFKEKGINSALDTQRGLDHGAWAILKLIYPEVDVPVVALSVNPKSSHEELYKTGAALKSLKKKGVLIIGSGGTVHNLAKVSFGSPFPDKWAQDFDKWIAQRLTTWETNDLFNYESKAPYARDAVPRGGNEHFIPLFIAMGAGEDEKKANQLHQSYQYGSLSLATWEFA